MAEEKKTTTKTKTTKSAGSTKSKTTTASKVASSKKAPATTKKKEEKVEEIRTEKRFCTKCGKELTNEETCNCESKIESPVTINSDAIMNTGKNIWNTIINVFKNPATTIEEELKTKDTNKAAILIGILAITFALYLMAFVSSTINNTINNLSNATASLISSSTIIKIPYFKIFIYGILIYAIISVIPILATIIVAKITRNNNYNFKKAFKLYTISNAPLTVAYIAMAIILLINIKLLNLIGFIGFAIVSVSCFFNFILTFDKETSIREDRRSYALTSVLIIWAIIEIVAIILVAGSVYSDLNINNKLINSNNNNNSFRW